MGVPFGALPIEQLSSRIAVFPGLAESLGDHRDFARIAPERGTEISEIAQANVHLFKHVVQNTNCGRANSISIGRWVN